MVSGVPTKANCTRCISDSRTPEVWGDVAGAVGRNNRRHPCPSRPVITTKPKRTVAPKTNKLRRTMLHDGSRTRTLGQRAGPKKVHADLPSGFRICIARGRFPAENASPAIPEEDFFPLP